MSPRSPQSRLAELLQSKSKTIKLIHSIGSLLEELLPSSKIWIFQSTHDGAAHEAAYCTKGPGSGTITSSCIAGFLQTHASKRAEDLLIADLANDRHGAALRSMFGVKNISSCIVRRIRTSHPTAWGYVVALFSLHDLPSEERQEALVQADLWIHLAITILERRLLEETLQGVETRLDLATKAGGVGIFDWEVSTDRLYCTPQMLKILGLKEQGTEGTYRHWIKHLHPDDAPILRQQLKETFDTHARYLRTSHRFYLPSGELRWLESLGEVFYDASGAPLRLLGTLSDCTDRVRAAQQIIYERKRLELALEAGELGLWDWNVTTGEVQYGSKWAQILGYAPNEIEGHIRAWEDLVHPDDMHIVRESLETHLDGITPFYETEHRLRAKGGEWVWVLDRGRVIERDRRGRPVRAIGVHYNITTERAIRDNLREGARRKDEFLAVLAHELRNPLAPIRTGVAIIRKDPTSPEAEQAGAIIERQLAHMVRLIDDLLDVSRITLGRLQLSKERVSVQSVVDMATETSRPAIDAGGHTLTISLPETEVHLNCDPTRVAQAVGNLLTNAAKYTPNGGAITLAVTAAERSVEIQVTDNGIGVSKEMQGYIFDLFAQIHPPTNRFQTGLGIGLALVRNLIELHDGRISMESGGVGQGSSFTVSLPIDQNAAPNRQKSEELIPAPSTSLSRRILIVDDNVDAATSLSMFAQLLGHTAETAFTGQEALDKLPTFHPDLIFLDIGLPDMSGIEIAKVIRSTPTSPTPHLVALTGWGDDETLHKTKEAGFDEHLTKPVELSTIEHILHGSLAT